MKKNSNILFCLILLASFVSCRQGNKNVAESPQHTDSTSVDVGGTSLVIKRVSMPLSSDFTNIVSVGRVNIVYTQGESCSLEIEGDSVLLSEMSIDEDCAILTLGLKPVNHLNRYGTSPHVTAYVTSPQLRYVTLCETGSFVSSGSWIADSDVQFGVMAQGSFHVDSLSCGNFLYQSSGDDKSTFSYIKATNVTLNATRNSSSTFHVDAFSLYVELGGTSEMTVSGRAEHFRQSCANTAKLTDEVTMKQ